MKYDFLARFLRVAVTDRERHLLVRVLTVLASSPAERQICWTFERKGLQGVIYDTLRVPTSTELSEAKPSHVTLIQVPGSCASAPMISRKVAISSFLNNLTLGKKVKQIL